MRSLHAAACIVPTTLLSAMPAVAQQAAAKAEPVSFIGELISIVLPLAFIILVLVAVLHFARRRYGSTGPDASLSVVQILPLGPRERVVLLKTRTGRLFAIGVTAHSVNLVTELAPDDLPARAPQAPVGAAPPRASKVFGLPLIRRDPPRNSRDAGPTG